MSATATYQASYAVTVDRSSHTLDAQELYGNSSTRGETRSSCAREAAAAEMSPANAERRRTLATSTGIRCGAASDPDIRIDSAQSPAGPALMSAATTTEASTTTVTCGQQRDEPAPEPRRSHTGSALTSSDAGHPHLGIWHTGKFDQPRPQVLLKGATRQRRQRGQLLAGGIGYIPDRDGLRHGSSRCACC